MNDFFHKNKVYVLTTLKFFNFVTDITMTEPNKVLSELLQEAQVGYSSELLQQDKVFEQVYIPRSLQELSHIDIDRQMKQGVETFYEKLTGLGNEPEAAEETQQKTEEYFEQIVKSQEISSKIEEIEEEGTASEGDEKGESSSEDEGEESSKKMPVSLAGMTKEEKKAHKQRVKEENREKRKAKMSKYEKQKAINKGKKK
jgi:RIO kinase 1